MRYPDFSRTGLTLIELVAALGLSAMFMAVCLTIVGRMSTSGKILLQKKAPSSWTHLLRQQLQRDYMGCRSIQVYPNRIRLAGYSSIGGGGFTPSEIEYRIVVEQDSNRVYRTEKRLLRSSSSRESKELVCDSIARFRAETTLTTDVAPGVLVLVLDVVPSGRSSDNTNSALGQSQQQQTGSDSKANLPGIDKMQMVLVRHGGGG